ncbi:MAG: hypothetical protein ACXWUP_07230 [Allosphingosinicella sp.]
MTRPSRAPLPVPDRDQGARRQGRAVRLALEALGTAEARAFLNRHHSGLSGRPLDLAMGSDDGLVAVEAAICIEARRPAESC